MLVIAGPNGAGKSTSALLLVHEMAGIDRYVNADAIARGFSPFRPDLSAVAAGRVVMDHIRTLGQAGDDFAIETTLSGLGLARRLHHLRAGGYTVQLIYLWLPSVDLAIKRVQQRVSMGGHSIPEETIRRRYIRSLWNLLHVYQPISDVWRVYDNSRATPRLVARGGINEATSITDPDGWRSLHASAGSEGTA